jgi:hypothetical protein
MEKSFGDFPRNGKNVSTLWKTLQIVRRQGGRRLSTGGCGRAARGRPHSVVASSSKLTSIAPHHSGI